MTRREKPPASVWLIDQRKRRSWTPLDVARRVDVAETTVRGWESGRNIGADSLIRLEAVFGIPAPGSENPPADQAALVEALREQTKAISALVAVLGAPQIPPRPTFEELQRWATELGATLVPPSANGEEHDGDDPPAPASPSDAQDPAQGVTA